MTDRDVALAEIAAIAERHGLLPDEVRAALAARNSAPIPEGGSGEPQARQGPLARALAYLGGTFVLTGLVVFVATFWDDMNSAERIVVTLGSGLCALVLAYMAHGSPKREGLTTPLFVIAVLLEPTGILVAFGELSTGGRFLHAQLAVALVMLCQCLLFFASVRRSPVLFCALVFTGITLGTALELLEVDGKVNGLIVGATCFLLTRAIQRTVHEAITPFTYFVSAVLVLVSWFELVEHRTLELSTVAVACGFVYLSIRFRSRTLLAAGCLGLLAYLGYFTGEHFADSLGWPLALILLGFVMMGLGTVAVRIHRKYLRAGP